uniref:Uncharacterized protein n=1 Tax=Lactiplantibacillus paraplantarum TaxID=60520 RepID=Q8RTK7_9LACO|nr:unknown [Lactiplantibacillus paraplantarum]
MIHTFLKAFPDITGFAYKPTQNSSTFTTTDYSCQCFIVNYFKFIICHSLSPLKIV